MVSGKVLQRCAWRWLSPIPLTALPLTTPPLTKGPRVSNDGLAVCVTGLRYAYPGGPTALDGVDLRVAAGTRLGLVGPNGAGKTTLFLCLAGVLGVKPGMARLAGLDPAVPAERRQVP